MADNGYIQFTDTDSGDEAVAIVRAVDGSIALCLSLERGGDIEVVMNPRDGERLLLALREALAVATVPR